MTRLYKAVLERHEAGLHPAEIARQTGFTQSWITRMLRSNGIEPHSGYQVAHDAERAAKMAHMFRQGVTLAKIGETFGVTRERVRQLLKKQGINRNDGGKSLSAQGKKDSREAVLNARSILKYGLSHEEMKAARSKGLTSAYRQQERSSIARGIEWGLTFAQWLQVWTLSGKLDQRGRGKGKYVMSRIKDSGGYVMGNVHIQLATENSHEAVAKWKGKTKENRGVFMLYPGSSKPWLAKYGRKVIGRFATEAEAVAARDEYMSANNLKPAGLGRGKGWTLDKRRLAKPYMVQAAGRNVGSFATQEEAEQAYQAFCAQVAQQRMAS